MAEIVLGMATSHGPMLSTPSQFSPGGPLHGTFWPAFMAAVTANIGAWASLSLNISDFSRFARSQRDQGGWGNRRSAPNPDPCRASP